MASRGSASPQVAPAPSPRGQILLIGAGAVAYGLAFLIGFLLPAYAKGFSAVWVAGGLALALLLRLPVRLWPWQLLAFFVAGNLANILSGRPAWASLGFMVANMAETAGSAWLMHRCCKDGIDFGRVRTVLCLLLCAWVVNALTAVLGAGTGALALGAPFGPFWATWAAADGLGILLVTPLLLSLGPRPNRPVSGNAAGPLETACFAVIWVLACYTAFNPGPGTHLHPYLTVGLLAYPAIRLGVPATAASVVVLAALTLCSTSVQVGPLLWGGETAAQRATEAQLYLAFAAMTGLLLAASGEERAATDLARRRAEQQYRGVVEHSADLITRVDAQGRLIFVNAAAADFWGLPADDCVGRSAADFIHPDDRDRTMEQFGQWLQTGERTAIFENRQGSAEHGWRDTLWACSLVVDATGNSYEAVSIARDITQRKVAEGNALQAARLDAVTRLAGGVAHSYNNALQAIMGHVDMAIEALPADSALRDDLSSIRALAVRTAAVTSQLLAFAAHRSAEPRDVDLNALVAGMLPSLRDLLSDRGTLEWQPDPALPQVHIDPTQMERALVALVANSRDAMGAGGCVTLATGSSACQDDSQHAAGHHVQLSVTDNGRGFDAEALSHLFEPFYTTKPLGHGTGIGLAAVRELILAMGGHVEVRPAVGTGTTVTLCLPCQQGPSVRAVARSDRRQTGHQAAILFVDDDDAVRRVTGRALTRRGYRVIEAASAEEAVALVERDDLHIDLLLTDIVMPGRGGHWLRERMAELRPDARCLLISGFAQDAAPEGAAFVAKPFSIDTLVRQAEQLMHG